MPRPGLPGVRSRKEHNAEIGLLRVHFRQVLVEVAAPVICLVTEVIEDAEPVRLEQLSKPLGGRSIFACEGNRYVVLEFYRGHNDCPPTNLTHERQTLWPL